MKNKLNQELLETLPMFIFLLDDVNPIEWIYHRDSIKMFCEKNNYMNDYNYIINKMDIIYENILNDNISDENSKYNYFNNEFPI